MFYFGLRRTFYPEYTLRPCAVLCQKGHTVWNSGSTFHQFWVEKKRRKAAYHPLTLCSLSHAGLPHLLCPFSLLVAQTSSKYLQQLCGDCSTRFIFSVFVVLLLVVDHLHVSILLDPQLAHDDVVNTTCRVCPCVGFIVPGGKIKTLRWILPIFSTLKLVYRYHTSQCGRVWRLQVWKWKHLGVWSEEEGCWPDVWGSQLEVTSAANSMIPLNLWQNSLREHSG